LKTDWRWLSFQVGVPLVLPALLSAMCVLAWESLDPTFVPDWRLVIDLTPWAIAVYSLTLIGSTFDRAWGKVGAGPLSLLWIVAGLNAIYYAFLVIRRHDPQFVVHQGAYFVTGVLMVVSILICYRAR
jgi:hypothetical protein